jgi:hypothetical protein
MRTAHVRMARLENWRRLTPSVSSNLTPSARRYRKVDRYRSAVSACNEGEITPEGRPVSGTAVHPVAATLQSCMSYTEQSTSGWGSFGLEILFQGGYLAGLLNSVTSRRSPLTGTPQMGNIFPDKSPPHLEPAPYGVLAIATYG